MKFKNIFKTLLKSSLMAYSVFWLMIFDEFEFNVIVLLSFIPVFIVSSFTICLTVLPFLMLEKITLNPKDIFKKHFSYYTIVAFVIASYRIICSNFSQFTKAFITSAFITLMHSWVCLYKVPKNQSYHDQI